MPTLSPPLPTISRAAAAVTLAHHLATAAGRSDLVEALTRAAPGACSDGGDITLPPRIAAAAAAALADATVSSLLRRADPPPAADARLWAAAHVALSLDRGGPPPNAALIGAAATAARAGAAPATAAAAALTAARDRGGLAAASVDHAAAAAAAALQAGVDGVSLAVVTLTTVATLASSHPTPRKPHAAAVKWLVPHVLVTASGVDRDTPPAVRDAAARAADAAFLSRGQAATLLDTAAAAVATGTVPSTTGHEWGLARALVGALSDTRGADASRTAAGAAWLARRAAAGPGARAVALWRTLAELLIARLEEEGGEPAPKRVKGGGGGTPSSWPAAADALATLLTVLPHLYTATDDADTTQRAFFGRVAAALLPPRAAGGAAAAARGAAALLDAEHRALVGAPAAALWRVVWGAASEGDVGAASAAACAAVAAAADTRRLAEGVAAITAALSAHDVPAAAADAVFGDGTPALAALAAAAARAPPLARPAVVAAAAAAAPALAACAAGRALGAVLTAVTRPPPEPATASATAAAAAALAAAAGVVAIGSSPPTPPALRVYAAAHDLHAACVGMDPSIDPLAGAGAGDGGGGLGGGFFDVVGLSSPPLATALASCAPPAPDFALAGVAAAATRARVLHQRHAHAVACVFGEEEENGATAATAAAAAAASELADLAAWLLSTATTATVTPPLLAEPDGRAALALVGEWACATAVAAGLGPVFEAAANAVACAEATLTLTSADVLEAAPLAAGWASAAAAALTARSDEADALARTAAVIQAGVTACPPPADAGATVAAAAARAAAASLAAAPAAAAACLAAAATVSAACGVAWVTPADAAWLAGAVGAFERDGHPAGVAAAGALLHRVAAGGATLPVDAGSAASTAELRLAAVRAGAPPREWDGRAADASSLLATATALAAATPAPSTATAALDFLLTSGVLTTGPPLAARRAIDALSAAAPRDARAGTGAALALLAASPPPPPPLPAVGGVGVPPLPGGVRGAVLAGVQAIVAASPVDSSLLPALAADLDAAPSSLAAAAALDVALAVLEADPANPPPGGVAIATAALAAARAAAARGGCPAAAVSGLRVAESVLARPRAYDVPVALIVDALDAAAAVVACPDAACVAAAASLTTAALRRRARGAARAATPALAVARGVLAWLTPCRGGDDGDVAAVAGEASRLLAALREAASPPSAWAAPYLPHAVADAAAALAASAAARPQSGALAASPAALAARVAVAEAYGALPPATAQSVHALMGGDDARAARAALAEVRGAWEVGGRFEGKV